MTDSMRKGIVSEITKRCLRGLREYWILIAALGWAVATWLYFSTDWAERTFKEGPTTETKIDHLKVFSQYIIGLAGALAFALAAWRSWTAHLQAKTAIRQTEIAERGQNVERYAKAAEMIGSERLAVRQAGIYALRELALIDRKVSGQVVLRLLSGFCRDRSNQQRRNTNPDSSLADIYDALGAILWIRQIGISKPDAHLDPVYLGNILLTEGVWPDAYFRNCHVDNCLIHSVTFFQCNFKHSFFGRGALTNTNFTHCDMTETSFYDATFENVVFRYCELEKAFFTRENLKSVRFIGCNMSGAQFGRMDHDEATFKIGTFVKDGPLTAQFTDCWAWADAVPDLDGISLSVFDPGEDSVEKLSFISRRSQITHRPDPHLLIRGSNSTSDGE